MISSSFRSLSCAAVAALFLSVAADAKPPREAAPPTEGPTVQLAPLNVRSVADYVPQEPGWTMAEVSGFRIYSRDAAAAKVVGAKLQEVRLAFSLIWQDERLFRQWLTVVVCADETEFLRWGNVPPASFDRLTRVLRTPSGSVLVVNGGAESIHKEVGRAYILALIQSTNLPRWLQEGLAATVNRSEVNGDRVVVGRIERNPRDQVPTEQLAALEMTMFSNTDPLVTIAPIATPGSSNGVGVFNRRGDQVEVLVNGMPTTVREADVALRDEHKRRMEQRSQAMADTEFQGYLNDTMVPELAKILDPKAPDSVGWRMSAWAFTHYSLFGDKGRMRTRLQAFLKKLQQDPNVAPVEAFRESYKLSPGKFELYLKLYARGASYDAPNFKLAEPFKPEVARVTPAPEWVVLLLKSRVYAATEREAEAREILQKGYADPGNRTPAYVFTLARAVGRADRAAALELLATAETKGPLDHAGRRFLAELRLEKLTAGDQRLGKEGLAQVMTPLFTCLNGGDESEQLFVLIGRTWLASSVPPKEDNLNALRLGLKLYPRSQAIAELLQRLEHRG